MDTRAGLDDAVIKGTSVSNRMAIIQPAASAVAAGLLPAFAEGMQRVIISLYLLNTFEMWCWRRMEKISWTDHVRNEDVLLRVNEQRSFLHEIRKRKANWIGRILRRNCLLKQVIEGNVKGEMEVTGRRGRRRKKLLDDLTDRKGYSHLKEEALDRTMLRNRFGGGFGPVVRQY